MSYDISLEYPTFASEDWNYTYNVAPMFQAAFGSPEGINLLHGITGASASDLLDAAIEVMEADPGMFREMNPENGWGDYEGALELLRQIKDGCDRHPEGRVFIN